MQSELEGMAKESLRQEFRIVRLLPQSFLRLGTTYKQGLYTYLYFIPQVSPPEPPQLKPTDLSKKKPPKSIPSATTSGFPTNHSSTPKASNVEKQTRERKGGEKRRKTGGFFGAAESLLCNQCSAGFGDFESFRAHLKTHLEQTLLPRKFSCEECEEEFTNEESLEAHATAHFLSTATEYGCSACRKLYAKPDELQKHLMVS